MDLAASIQAVCEDAMLAAARHLRKQTGLNKLVMAGGVALNCVGNGKIIREAVFDDIWIQPAAGDAGGALGVALIVWHELLAHPRTPPTDDSQKGSLLGPEFSDGHIRATLDRLNARYTEIRDEKELLERACELLEQEKIIGWFQGRMEFGPRALGARSILGDPRSTRMQQVMNLKIKFRESFRPFAPSVLREETSRVFELPPSVESPYMLLVAPVADHVRIPSSVEAMQGLCGIERLNVPRSHIPAVTHVDFSARIQTVDEQRNPRYWRLLRRFHERTGCPVVVNTSFNVRGEPIVCTPEDAYRCFMGTHIDALVIGSFVLLKEEQKQPASIDAESYRAQFALD
jgi:carbamoyltransferase